MHRISATCADGTEHMISGGITADHEAFGTAVNVSKLPGVREVTVSAIDGHTEAKYRAGWTVPHAACPEHCSSRPAPA